MGETQLLRNLLLRTLKTTEPVQLYQHLLRSLCHVRSALREVDFVFPFTQKRALPCCSAWGHKEADTTE